eukprot:CAMPEP_0174940758 /NCGR_PEP_ID=MMETSP1355-20121228/69976_1 /TAXON_ID=464990 /ORGANISM="Hemiselmis tepida, Strain CCMP443" /LENGTH=101 /DNA_ID=CAMNT_0016187827 /DNA_START=29 /DNA_END=330 /DNA_ORIENTATION=-
MRHISSLPRARAMVLRLKHCLAGPAGLARESGPARWHRTGSSQTVSLTASPTAASPPPFGAGPSPHRPQTTRLAGPAQSPPPERAARPTRNMPAASVIRRG